VNENDVIPRPSSHASASDTVCTRSRGRGNKKGRKETNLEKDERIAENS